MVTERFVSGVESYFRNAPKSGDEVLVIRAFGRPKRGKVIGKRRTRWAVELDNGDIKLFDRGDMLRLEELEELGRKLRQHQESQTQST